MNLEKRIEKLENKVAKLEGRVQVQSKLDEAKKLIKSETRNHVRLDNTRTIWESSLRQLSDQEIKQFQDKIHSILLNELP